MLTDLQLKLIEMMDWFHNYCKKNNLRYYCLGGTMLGAARHNGFIPWDDDIDVGLPRKDYEKLISLAGGKTTDEYYLENYLQDKKDFVYSYAKLYDTRTTLIENTRFKTKRGIYIDIFPLDGMGNTLEEAFNNYKEIEMSLNLLSSKTCALRKNRKLYKNVAIILARCIPDFFVSHKKLIKKINEFGESRCFDEFKYVSNIDGNWRKREIVPRSAFGDPTIYTFNGINVYGVADPDTYLTCLYGDWKKLPPKEKQITHHDYVFIDLNKSYMD